LFAAPGRAPLLTGTEFELEIEPVPLTINGRRAMATGVNGQIPAPILRWREGDTLTLAVTNRLSEPSSIHWHGVPHALADGRRARAQLSRHRAR
jgi:FtsP/CotA-like multicopper oxidase with cupredoxin domain